MPDYSCSLYEADGRCPQAANIGNVYGAVNSVPTAAMLTECAQMIHSYIAGANTQNCMSGWSYFTTKCWNAASGIDGTCWCNCIKDDGSPTPGTCGSGMNHYYPPTSGGGIYAHVYECTT